MFDFIVQSGQKRISNELNERWKNNQAKLKSVAKMMVILHFVDGHLDVWIAEDDWDCSCTSKVSPCQHVLLSVLAIRQGVAKPKMKTIIKGNNIRYKLLNHPLKITLNRVWVQNSEELHFTGQGALSAFDESIERLFFI